jgi:hypothetical protein
MQDFSQYRIARVLFHSYKDETAVRFSGARFIAAYRRRTFFKEAERKLSWVTIETIRLNDDWNLVTGFVSLWDTSLPEFVTNIADESVVYWLRSILSLIDSAEPYLTGRLIADHFIGSLTEHDYSVSWAMDYHSFIDKNFNGQSLSARNTVFLFKDGHSPQLTARMMAWCVKKMNRRLTGNSDVSLVCIPASSEKKFMLRCRLFSEYLSADLRINNALKAIRVEKDREPLKGTVGGNKLFGLSFHNEYVRDKEVLLFDDVYNHGESFRQISSVLLGIGARKVTGICIAKTYRHEEQQLSKQPSVIPDIEEAFTRLTSNDNMSLDNWHWIVLDR